MAKHFNIEIEGKTYKKVNGWARSLKLAKAQASRFANKWGADTIKIFYDNVLVAEKIDGVWGNMA